MPSILNLKFKGNKSFVAFSNLPDSEALAKTWKVCTKVASYLEQGQRLENLSWRLWHVQSLLVDADNAKSKREFKKLSKCMGDKLDKEKGRSIEELEAPDFKHNPSSEMIRKRAAEKERERQASQSALPGMIKRTQFTFSVQQPDPAVSNAPVHKPDTRPSPEFNDSAAGARNHAATGDIAVVTGQGPNEPRNKVTTKTTTTESRSHSLRFPTLFSSDFGPSALLNASPTDTTHMDQDDESGVNSARDGLNIVRPTIELPLDELLTHVEAADSPWSSSNANGDCRRSDGHISPLSAPSRDDDVVMRSVPDIASPYRSIHTYNILVRDRNRHEDEDEDHDDDSDETNDSDIDLITTSRLGSSSNHDNNTSYPHPAIPPLSQTVKEILPKTIAPFKIGPRHSGFGSQIATGRPTLTVRTQATPNTRSSGPGATATSMNPSVIKHTNSAPGGVKAECSNCGATHTPLWRRGLNDELNCNACGLYCKLHKRPRPKSMRNNHGEGRTQTTPRHENIDVMAQCYNCHTTATPLWRKDDEGKTVCNACGLYYKLHGSARPISMKSDVIRKRSRHDARRMQATAETPTVSPCASRRPSPIRDLSPTLAPDSTTQLSYRYHEESDYRSSQSELMGALGSEVNNHVYSAQSRYTSTSSFPGPYHPDYMPQPLYSTDALPFASVDLPGLEGNRRTTKRRRMSTDSASEPPSSAVSYSSYSEGYSASSPSSHSQRSSMDFPFSAYPSYHILRGTGSNAFWHPPMSFQDSPQFIHPPMLPPTEDSHMDCLHPPMRLPGDEDSLFSAYFHPPMLHPDEHGHMQFSNDGIYSSGSPDHYDTNMHTF